MSALYDLARQLERVLEQKLDTRVTLQGDDPASRDVERLLNALIDLAHGASRESEKAEQDLSRKESVLKQIVNSIPYSIFWKDRESSYLGCNDNFCRDGGKSSPEELIGKNDYDMPWTREESDFFRKCDREVMDSGKALMNIEEPQARAGGKQTWLLTSKVPLRDDQGEVYGLLGIYADITERKRMEEDLRAARDAAEAAHRAKSAFFANVSHELRTPLTLIAGPVQGLLADSRNELSADARLKLEIVRRNAARLGGLVNDLLDASKLEAGKMQVILRPVRPAELLALLVDDAQPAAAARGVTLSFSSDPIDVVPLDRRMFEKIALNLLSNAIKFTPAGGSVEVALRARGEQFELSVTDTGIGIPDEDLPRLFTRFVQVDDSAARKHEGTGLGLAIVKEMTELMAGQVTVASEHGKGSCFTVTLPRDEARLASVAAGEDSLPELRGAEREALRLGAAQAAEVASEAALTGKPLVLCAEDNPDMRAYVCSVLAQDFDVIAVENGWQALDALREQIPAAIVSDIMMPGMDGHELLRRLKADPLYRRLPVIMLTARADHDAVTATLEQGADDYLGKPFSPAELRARVRAAIRAYAMSITNQELCTTRDLLVDGEKIATAARIATELSQELGRPMNDASSPWLQLPAEGPHVAQNLRDVLSEVAREAGLAQRYRLTSDEGANPIVHCAASDLRSCLARLLTFFAAHSAGGSELSCALRNEQGRTVLTLADGSSHAPGELARALEPHIVASPDGSPRLALDLPLARHLARRNGAELTVDATGSALELRF